MPLYEYACRSCGHQFEARQKITDEPLKACPSCHKEAAERLVSRSSFALKGAGWYADGYGSKSGGDGGDTAKDGGVKSSEGAKEFKVSGETTIKESAKPEPKSEAKSEPVKKASDD